MTPNDFIDAVEKVVAQGTSDGMSDRLIAEQLAQVVAALREPWSGKKSGLFTLDQREQALRVCGHRTGVDAV